MFQSLESIVKDYWAKAEQEKNEFKIREASNVSYFLKTIQRTPLCWIKCSDRLPNRDGTYLVVTDGKHNVVYDMARYDSIDGWHKASEIIYWMPIPQLNNKSIIEKMPVDKVESKFRVGDWITNGKLLVGQVTSFDGEYYRYMCDGLEQLLHVSNAHNWHLWTISDARDGDVLVRESGWTCIFKTLVNDETFSSYCFMDNTKWFCETGSECHTLKEEFGKAYNGKIYPATKEQRKQFEKAMAAVGYEWDAKKKELKEIEVNIEELSDFEQSLKHIIEEAIEDGDTHNLKADADMLLRIAHKSTWNEEDEKYLQDIIEILDCLIDDEDCGDMTYEEHKEYYMKRINWLKDRVITQSK